MTERRENSGLIDLDALLKNAEASAPAPVAAAPPASDSLEAVTTDVASTPKVETPAAPPLTAPASPPRSTPATAPATTPKPAPRPTIPATPLAKRSPSTRKTAAMIAVGAAIVASAVTFTVSRGRHAPGPSSAVASPPPAATLEAKPAATVANAEPALDPNALPAAITTTPETNAAPASARSRNLGNVAARAAAAVATANAPAEANVALGEVASANEQATGDLGNAMRSAVGDRATKTVTNDESAGSGAGQVRPSQGAVVGAINSVLPGARACLGPDDPVRSALVVFKSDGSVKSVELRGSKDADTCVKGELSKARVAPFADDSFSTRVTVRP